MSNLTFTDDAYVKILGAVRNPGEYQYDESLSLLDIITMAGGFKREAASTRIDLFRVQIKDDEPTKTVVATVALDRDLKSNPDQDIRLEPFDQIVVRTAPEFEFQRIVEIYGEVKFPGPYALISKNEKISSLIKRAGGLTDEAFAGGASLYRPKDGVGYIVMSLDDALESTGSKYNYILKDEDMIDIPKKKDFVTIKGETRASELYDEKVIQAGKITTPFFKNKNALFYVNRFAAGIGDNGRRRLITVEHPNGQIRKTKDFFFFKIYPKVKKGSIVSVGKKPERELDQEKERKDIDWGKVFADSIIQATSILTLILLVQRLD